MTGERILIADDEEHVLDICERILSSEGYQVTAVNSGREAIDLVAREHFDLFLTDIKMPGVTGLEASRAVKQVAPHVICVVMTAFATKETAIEALKLGIDEFVVKPFSPDELSLAVTRALEKERLRQENSRLRALIPLFELNRLFMGRLTLASLLPEVLAIARREVKASFAALYLRDEGGRLVSHTQGAALSEAEQALQQAGYPIAERVLAGREQVAFGRQAEGGPAELAAWAVVASPLLTGETLLGVLLLAKGEADFTPSDRDFLAVLSSQVAIAVENARLFAEVQQAYEELKALDHMKSEFINIAAHELRTPLAILMGYANILEESATGEDQGYLHIIVRNAMRMRSLIDDMLNMAYVETGKARLNPAPLLLDEVVAEVISDMRLLAQEHSLVLTSEISEEFPELNTDRQKLELILSNLLSNAIKFTPEGGSITFRAVEKNGMAQISVSDTGIGIPAREREKIFERFYQVEESLTRGHGGLGLGLAIAKGMVSLAGGEIWVESQEGKGSTFTFTLPMNAV